MYNERSKRVPKILFSQLGVIFIMVALALVILYYAEGYRVNFNTLKLTKTGVVYLSTYPKGADVYLDGKLQRDKTPYTQNLLPGFYGVEVRKDGYQDWDNSFKIDGGMVDSYKSIVLFLKNPAKEPLSDPGKINLVNNPLDILADRSADRLTINNDYEIWEGDKLITRFSSPVLGAIWYPDDSHVVFQQSNEIRVMDSDGTNNILLTTLHDDTPTRFAVNGNGNELYFLDKGQYYFCKIR